MAHSTLVGIVTSFATCILSIAFFDSTLASAQSVPEILNILWDKTSGSSWQDNAGWDGYPNSYCQDDWVGIQCYDVDDDHELYGHIKVIDLNDNKLVGTLPPEIFAIPHLSELILRDNPDLTVSFVGIEKASSLKRMVVSRCHIEDFDGLETANDSLEELHITGCGYEGSFPMQVTQLTKLKGFFSNYNNIDGPIPDEISNMEELRELYLFNNAITGPIPPSLDVLTKLEVLVLSDNWITGSIPQGINNLSALRLLAVSDNQLKGSVPAFDNLNQISELYLQNNNLEGSVPLDFLFNAPKHDEINVDLSNNNLSGKFMGIRLKEFDFLNIYLSGNKFEDIDELLCTREGWMNGNVGEYGCDAIMCPLGSFSPDGRRSSDVDVCESCASESLGFKYMGSNDCGNEQKTILRSMYYAMSGQNWVQNNWIFEDDECTWTGISCDEEGYVAHIELSSFGLSGYIPIQVFALPELATLDLSNNFIRFKFDGIGEASNLRTLNLFNIGLDSLEDIEQLSGTSLQTLILSSNNIDDVIPDVIWGLDNLRELIISYNKFHGPISEEIGNLQNLRSFHAYGNQLTGEIPSTISDLQDTLEELVLSENDFFGEIPDGMDDMHVLETFSLHQVSNSNGGISGFLPSFINCYSLTTLHLNGNSIEGELPNDFLANSDHLDDLYIEVDLSSNYLEGQIPRTWNRFRYFNIDLANNQIEHIPRSICENDDWQNGFVGESNYDCNYILCDRYTYNAKGRASRSETCIPCDSAEYFGATYCENDNADNLDVLESLYASTNGNNWQDSLGWFSTNDVCDGWHGIYCDDDGIDIVRIDLSDNGLTGTPSTKIFTLPKLRELLLHENAINFSFDGIEAASKLKLLYLSKTRISSLEGISKAKSLKELHLTECYLSGPLPNELFSLVNLESLFMNYNQFNGRIPPTISQLSKLKNLYLMSNELSGPLPAAIGELNQLEVLSLTNNRFSGSIPDEFNKLENIVILSIEHERKNKSLTSGNKRRTQEGFGLSGQLPSFDKLANLQELLLGYNSLTGTIPYNFLEGIIDKARSLKIDLEHNMLEGNVPSSLTQFAEVQTSLEGNKFTGIAPGLCNMVKWNDGDVKINKCNGILCPKNTFSTIGRQSSEYDCTQCPESTSALYLGSSECLSDDEGDEDSERNILLKLFEDLKGPSWKSHDHWYDDDISFCKWFGITCAPGGKDSVEAIRLPDNGLVGHITRTIFDLPNLKELNFGKNEVTINFAKIPNTANLQFLNLDRLGLKSISGIETLSSLKVLHLASNKFPSFPPELLQLQNLEILYLSHNNFDMNIPDLSNLTHLKYFQCKRCSFTGKIPNWMGDMQSLQFIALPGNQLTGSIPVNLTKLKNLEHLDLSEQVPRGGGLTGELPTFDTLENLSDLYLSRNKLSGEVQDSFLQGSLSQSISVDLRYNDLSGGIPDSFIDRFDDLTLLLAENEITSLPKVCENTSIDLNWNSGDMSRFGCDALLCSPGYYSPIGRKTSGRRYNCEPCDSDDSSDFFGSTTCGHIPDKVALEAVYNSLNGPNWNNNDYWMENDLICEWYGVICDDDGENVIGLDLENNGLEGSLPTEMFDLTSLTTLNLKMNHKVSLSLTGIEKLGNLHTLTLSDMGLTSVDGLDAATSLKVLHLTGNLLDVIPDEIYSLVNLRELYMNYNKMEGSISSKIGQLSKLRELYMFRNKLSGNLPEELGQLQELRTMGLGENSFSGDLPSSLNDLNNIKVIALQHSRASSQTGPGGPLNLDKGDFVGLTGRLLSFENSPRLTELYLGYNDFEGDIPENFLASVETTDDVIVDLTMNHIEGTLPIDLQRFEFMTIYISGNKIDSLDESFCDLDSWMGGDVETNGCNAILCPDGTANVYGRQSLVGPICKPCAFTFTAPYYGSAECIADQNDYNEKEILMKLFEYTKGSDWSVSDNWNDDTVSICEWHGIHCESEDISGGVQVVKEISLASNKLLGNVPPQVFDLQYLEVLNLRDNKVNVDLSSLLSDRYSIKALYLDNTHISSMVGVGKLKNLRTLHLQQNNFAGLSIPTELFELSKLKRLFLSDSNIGGELPSAIGKLSALELFYSHNNELTGEIPSEIGTLAKLETLVLSENRFVGPLPDMSNMESLQSLLIDSYTRRGAGLSGPVPQFDGMVGLREVFLNENSFTGTISNRFLADVSDVRQTIKVGLKGNRVEGSLPKSLRRFQKLDIDLADNLITGIHPDLCSNDYWMSGYVGRFNCDAILCPAGYYNQFGRQDSSLLPCKKCSGDEQLPYLGATECQAQVKKREREVLQIFYEECGGVKWKNDQNWMKEDVDHCHWYGIQCNDEGSIDSILLGSNNLSGTVPRELFQLKSLKWLWLYSNPVDFSFHGIGEAKSLTSLLLDSTGLSSLDGVGQAYQLTDLEVRFNRLSGPIPDDLNHLVNLETLSMSNNDFTGDIPSFNRLHRLKSLRLSDNRLHGILPSFASNSKLRTLDLSDNGITGSIPPNFLAALPSDETIYIDLTNNKLTGEIPSGLGRFDRMTIYLRDNYITNMHEDLCDKEFWNDGDVGKFSCDAILCPPGTFAPGRGRESQSSPCQSCDKAKFYGQTACEVRQNSAPSMTTVSFLTMLLSLSAVIGMIIL